jgi:hypothetical protein
MTEADEIEISVKEAEDAKDLYDYCFALLNIVRKQEAEIKELKSRLPVLFPD